MAVKPLPEFDLYISTVLPLENKGIRWVHPIPFLYHRYIYKKRLDAVNLNSLMVVNIPHDYIKGIACT